MFPEWTHSSGPGILYLPRNCSVPATWEPQGSGTPGQRSIQSHSHLVSWTFQKTYRQWVLLGAEPQMWRQSSMHLAALSPAPSLSPGPQVPGLILSASAHTVLPFPLGSPGKASLTRQSVSDPQGLFQNAAKEKGKVWPGHWPARMISSPFYPDVFGDAPQDSRFLTGRGSGYMS